ncbi:unnamed protein product, partial [Rotaria socialis]
MAQWSERW